MITWKTCIPAFNWFLCKDDIRHKHSGPESCSICSKGVVAPRLLRPHPLLLLHQKKKVMQHSFCLSSFLCAIKFMPSVHFDNSHNRTQILQWIEHCASNNSSQLFPRGRCLLFSTLFHFTFFLSAFSATVLSSSTVCFPWICFGFVRCSLSLCPEDPVAPMCVVKD